MRLKKEEQMENARRQQMTCPIPETTEPTPQDSVAWSSGWGTDEDPRHR